MGKPLIAFCILGLIVIEALSNTLYINEEAYDPACASIAYFVAGLCIALLPLVRVKSDTRWYIAAWVVRGIKMLGLIVIGLFLFIEAKEVFAKVPVDYHWADMLPIMKIMCQRLVDGKEVYAIIEQIWGGIEPIYLPAIWLPLLPATVMEVDVRWTAMLLFMLALVFALSTRPKGGEKGKLNFVSLLTLVPLLILVHHWMIYESRFFTMTEESIVVFYYLFLAFAISRKQPSLIALALSLCMLSRYSLAIWALVYVAYEFFWGERQTAWRIIWVGGTFSLVLLWGTQALWNLDIFLGLQANYLDAIIHEEHKFGALVKEGLGLAKFYAYENLAQLHQLFLISAIATPILSFAVFELLKKRIDKELFLLCSLKLSLVFFYNTLIMPFVYLFFTSTLLSIALLHYYLSYEAVQNSQSE